MRLRCIHGYFIFQETRVGQISDFMSWSGFSLVSKGTYYTFKTLAEAPDYSLALKSVLGWPATKAFEGEPWEVFEENGLVYDFTKDLIVPILSILQITPLKEAGNRYIAPGLILPGSITSDRKRIKGFDAWFSRDRLTWLYSEVEFV